jgi:hypothetical protein
MTMELVLLLASVVFGMVQIIVVSHLQSWRRGYRWTAGSREQSAAPLIRLAEELNECLEITLRPSGSSPLQISPP